MLIKIESIHLSFKEQNILKNISIDIVSGELVGVLGPNGSGKTSFLKILGNLLKPIKGKVFIDEVPINTFSIKDLSKLISYLPQEIEVVWPLSVEQVISLGLIPYSFSQEFSQLLKIKKIKEIMYELNLEKFSKSNFNNLSTGEKARIMFARALVGEPKILLADEPVASLDPYYQLVILDLLKAKAKQGMSVIVALHDLTHAGQYCDKLMLLSNGNLLAYGEPEKVLTKKNISETYKINAEVGSGENFFVMPTKIL